MDRFDAELELIYTMSHYLLVKNPFSFCCSVLFLIVTCMAMGGCDDGQGMKQWESDMRNEGYSDREIHNIRSSQEAQDAQWDHVHN